MKDAIRKFWNEEGAHLKPLDYLVIAIMMILYGILSFHQLGVTSNPETYFYVMGSNNQVDIELKEKTSITKIRHFTGGEMGTYELFYSLDGNEFTPLDNYLEQDAVFAWKDYDTDQELKYLRIVGLTDNSQLGDIQLYDRYGNKVEATAMNDISGVVLDEIDTVPDQISFENSTYFDEIYFARAAYEYMNKLPAYEWVHPPLGKAIQMIPMLFMGMNPFSYRLMGNIAGILMIPALYILAKNMFKKRKYAILAGSLMALDTFHFAQCRLGTVDSFLVLFLLLSFLFMYQYISLTKKDSLWKRLIKLFFSGFFVGCAIATKWTGLFGGLALAIIFFADLIYKNFGKDKHWTTDTTLIILACVGCFIIVPILIYVGCYFMFPNMNPYQITDLSSLIEETKAMYQYHATLDATHPFTSAWYSWPYLYKPVWYYVSYFAGNMRSTISCIGNPAIWWPSILALVYVLIEAFRSRKKEYWFIIVAFLCMWLPYSFIGRVMFLYHYFPALPFAMLALVALFKYLTDKLHLRHMIVIYFVVVLVFFLLFYPMASGMLIPGEYADFMQWLPQWFF